jgi:hypothetical protein
MDLTVFVRSSWVRNAQRRIRVNMVLRYLGICFLSAFFRRALVSSRLFLNECILIHCRWLSRLDRPVREPFFVIKSDNICQSGVG